MLSESHCINYDISAYHLADINDIRVLTSGTRIMPTINTEVKTMTFLIIFILHLEFGIQYIYIYIKKKIR